MKRSIEKGVLSRFVLFKILGTAHHYTIAKQSQTDMFATALLEYIIKSAYEHGSVLRLPGPCQ